MHRLNDNYIATKLLFEMFHSHSYENNKFLNVNERHVVSFMLMQVTWRVDS